MLGKLTWAAIPLDQPLPLYAMGVVGIVILAVLGIITQKGWFWGWSCWCAAIPMRS
jgi:cytochrome o ubiquinol oxidase subunit I